MRGYFENAPELKSDVRALIKSYSQFEMQKNMMSIAPSEFIEGLDLEMMYRRFNIRSKNFITVFRIRQMVRELRSAITVVFRMFVALLVIMLGLDSYVMCKALKENNSADTHYEYMYLYKYPDKEVPA